MKKKELYRSSLKFVEAQNLIPGGVNSPARAFKSVGGTPPFMKKAKGSKLFDIDGNEYIDYIGSWGPMILGHAHPTVQDALKKQVDLGTSFGTPTEIEVEMAQLIVDAVPSIEMVRMVSSGTEATMSAIRLARGYTGRDKVIKFNGCYHGHGDMLLAEAGSGVATLGIPGCPGVPEGTVADTITLSFNDIEAVKKTFEKHADSIAAVILEPVVGNMGLVLPRHDFLKGLRDITQEHKALLIFDEVMTGFRLHFGGAQTLFGITPDMTCLGKIVGGGLPVGAYGGRKEIMETLAPVGPVYQAGTLSGNPVAMQAGFNTLSILKEHPEYYEALNNKGTLLAHSLKEVANKHDIPVTINQIGSMMSIFFTENEVFDFASAKTSNTERFKSFFHGMLEQGIYLPPSQFESWFISIKHDEKDLEKTIKAADQVMASLKGL